MKFIRWLSGFIFLAGLIIIIFAFLKVSAPSKLMLFLLICFLLSLFRVLKGPTAADRSVATDIFGILVIGFCAILAVYTGKDWYMDIAIAWGLQSFIGVLALAKFLEGRHFDE
ncbi:MAG: multiple resistance and pH regulation protein F [Candidatus Omnitrophica bacterium]|nr:multiple resistance and pH regulation protein F [Candidatus Omnitrophota bacterium]